MNKGIEAFFTGMVQGVGFRFTARDLADKHKIKGWVMNLSDGRVKLVAQGSQKELNNFLYDLREKFKNQIINFQFQKKEPLEDYNSFQIKTDFY